MDVILTSLPKDCLVLILSRTSPKDVLRSSAVCKNLFCVSQDDAVWENFLPSDYHEIISDSSSPLPEFTSKKNLFLHLCHTPIFLRNHTQMFALDRWSGKKCYTVGARALGIAWGNGETPWYWHFRSMPESRWSLPEIRDCVEEAGFKRVHFWIRQMPDTQTNRSIRGFGTSRDDKYEEVTSFQQHDAWNAYVVAVV